MRMVSLVAGVLALAACVQVNEAVTGRDLDCNGAPEDVCIRAADLGVKLLGSDMRREHPGRDYTIIIAPTFCAEERKTRPDVARCWNVELSAKPDGGGFGLTFVELVDGTVVTS